jgi:hypothetical protein
MTARVVRPDDPTAVESADVLDPPKFDAARSAEYLFHLPLAQLAPGPYRLAIQADVDRASAARDVLFVVR